MDAALDKFTWPTSTRALRGVFLPHVVLELRPAVTLYRGSAMAMILRVLRPTRVTRQ